jgi:antitoxin component HigA of HigAB toxin-antitoxin module
VNLPRSAGLRHGSLRFVSPSRRAGSQRSNLQVILRGERRLTQTHVRTLAKRLRVSGDLFLP